MTRVTIYNEFIHEQEYEGIRKIYPEGIHGCIKSFLQENPDIEITATATFEQPEHGLTEEILKDTDVLVYWSHARQEDFSDEVTERIKKRVLEGMGLVALHSAHYSRLMRSLLGTSMTLKWKNDESERISVTCPDHPIANGIPEQFDLIHEEMYGEFFDIPKPDDVIFTGNFSNGQVFRSGVTFTRGKGKIFYFQPGHEEYPVYHNPIIQRIITNGVLWCSEKSVSNNSLTSNVKRDNIQIKSSPEKISVFWDHITDAVNQSGLSLEEVLQKVSRAGYRGIDIRLEQLEAGEEKNSELLKNNNLEVASIYEMYGWQDNFDFENAKKIIDAAVRHNTGRVLVVPGFLVPEDYEPLKKLKTRKEIREFMKSNPRIQNIRKGLIEICRYAEGKNVLVTLEDFDSINSPCSRKEELLYFMQNVPGLKFTLDMGNFAFNDEDVLDSYETLQEYIAHVHCKDRGSEAGYENRQFTKGLATVSTGKGYLPVERLVKLILSKGYNAYFTAEHFGSENQIVLIQESAEFLLSIK